MGQRPSPKACVRRAGCPPAGRPIRAVLHPGPDPGGKTGRRQTSTAGLSNAAARTLSSSAVKVIVGVVGVVEPRPIGRQDEIAPGHRHALTIDDGVAAAALDDQAKRRPGMPTGAGDLARHHDLDVGDERIAGDPGELRVGQAQNPAFGLPGPDKFGRPHRLRPQIAPMPQIRYPLALRFAADAAADPGRRDVLRPQLRVIGVELLRRGNPAARLSDRLQQRRQRAESPPR